MTPRPAEPPAQSPDRRGRARAPGHQGPDEAERPASSSGAERYRSGPGHVLADPESVRPTTARSPWTTTRPSPRALTRKAYRYGPPNSKATEGQSTGWRSCRSPSRCWRSSGDHRAAPLTDRAMSWLQRRKDDVRNFSCFFYRLSRDFPGTYLLARNRTPFIHMRSCYGWKTDDLCWMVGQNERQDRSGSGYGIDRVFCPQLEAPKERLRALSFDTLAT